MEDLAARGARVFIGVGLITTIHPDIKIGDIIILTLAIRGEGNSYYYLPKEINATPDQEVVNAIIISLALLVYFRKNLQFQTIIYVKIVR